MFGFFTKNKLLRPQFLGAALFPLCYIGFHTPYYQRKFVAKIDEKDINIQKLQFSLSFVCALLDVSDSRVKIEFWNKPYFYRFGGTLSPWGTTIRVPTFLITSKNQDFIEQKLIDFQNHEITLSEKDALRIKSLLDFKYSEIEYLLAYEVQRAKINNWIVLPFIMYGISRSLLFLMEARKMPIYPAILLSNVISYFVAEGLNVASAYISEKTVKNLFEYGLVTVSPDTLDRLKEVRHIFEGYDSKISLGKPFDIKCYDYDIKTLF